MKELTIVLQVNGRRPKWLLDLLKQEETIKGVTVKGYAEGDVIQEFIDIQEDLNAYLEMVQNSEVESMTVEEAHRIVENESMNYEIPRLIKRPGDRIPRC